MFEHRKEDWDLSMKWKALWLVVVGVLAIPTPAHAVGVGNMPWESPLGKMEQSLKEPVAPGGDADWDLIWWGE
jgi:hypothetical protein